MKKRNSQLQNLTGEPFKSTGHQRRVAWARKQAGFIITIELMLIMTILGIGLFVGVVAIRDALFKHYVIQRSNDVYVSDSNGIPLGKAISFDEHEAPLIPYIDRTVGDGKNYRALIGIRDDRFTSREPIYFTSLNCAGPQMCMKRPSDEITDSRGLEPYNDLLLAPPHAPPDTNETGAVGYLYALQQGPTYAIGPANFGAGPILPGWLYRLTDQACDYTDLDTVGSRYISQKVSFGSACESPYQLPLPSASDPVQVCTGDPGDPTAPLLNPPSATCPQVSVLGNPACGILQDAIDGTYSCQCPLSYFDVGDVGAGDAVVHTCCANGSTAGPVDPITGFPVLCLSEPLFLAESVPDRDGIYTNAFEPFEPPFTVNLPMDPDSFNSTAPDGCEGVRLLDGSCPVNNAYPIFTPPDGVEGN